MSNKIFFIGDMHIGHENVLRFDRRPYETVEEMNKDLIDRWNRKVAKGDLVYILGDIIWKNENNQASKILQSLNGQKILIKGNHDKFLHNANVKNLLAAVKDYDDICVETEKYGKKRVILSHYFIPMYNGARYGAIHLHAHSHTTEEAVYELEMVEYLKSKGLDPQIYNVGCMYWNYEPVTLDEILDDPMRNEDVLKKYYKS